MRTIALGLAIIFASCVTTIADDFEAGLEAYQAGDFNKAIEKWEPLAQAGDAQAQHNMGLMLYLGKGFEVDLKAAFQWYLRSAQQENSAATYAIGYMFENGEGTDKNLFEASDWYGKALQLGYADAGKGYSRVQFAIHMYGDDVRKMDSLSQTLESDCGGKPDCAFETVWKHLDISADGNLSLAELSRFQRDLVKYAFVKNNQPDVKLEDVAALSAASILLLPITSTSVINSFDYNADGTLQKIEIVGDTEFAKLVGLNSETIADGIDLKSLGQKLVINVMKLKNQF